MNIRPNSSTLVAKSFLLLFAVMVIGIFLLQAPLAPSSARNKKEYSTTELGKIHPFRTVTSQKLERSVVKRPWPLEPVQITEVRTKNKGKIEIGSVFDEDDDWLEGLAVTVTNDSKKIVTAITISITFRREAGDTRPPFAWNLHFGPSPSSPEYLQRDQGKVIKVGQTADLQVSSQNYENLKRSLEKSGYTNSISRVELEIREVGFADGSMIYSGTFYLQDPASPNDPTKKIKISEPPGAQNKKTRSPPDHVNSANLENVDLPNSDASFLNSSFRYSFSMPGFIQSEDCRAQEGQQRRLCSAEFTACSITRDFLEPFQVGPYALELKLENCEFFFQNEWQQCGEIQTVDRYIFCRTEIPCGNQSDTCVMPLDGPRI